MAAQKHSMFIEADREFFLMENPTLADLEASVGAFWYDTPDQCVARYRELIHDGYLPQIRRHLAYYTPIPWRPEDREKAPVAWDVFVRELCGSTDAVMRVEGHFLSFGEARTDREYQERASRFMEEAVTNALILDSTGLAIGLVKDFEGFYHATNIRYQPQRELIPERVVSAYWADFARIIDTSRRATTLNMRADFLRTNAQFDNLSFQTQFLWNTYPPVEMWPIFNAGNVTVPNQNYTKSEAEVLLPLARAYKTQIIERRDARSTPGVGWINMVTNTIAQLEAELEKALAGPVARPVPPSRWSVPEAPVAEIVATNPLQVGRFWAMPLARFDHNVGPFREVLICAGMRFREGKFWLEVLNGNNGNILPKAFIFGVDLETFQTEVIELPVMRRTLNDEGVRAHDDRTGDTFEVLRGYVYFCIEDKIKRYSLKTKTWEDTSIPVQGRASMTVVDQRLLITTADSIMRMNGNGDDLQILASARRRPALNPVDSLDGYGRAPIFPGSAGSFQTILAGKMYSYNAKDNAWTQVEIAIPAGPLSCAATCDSAALLRAGNSLLLLHCNPPSTELVYTAPTLPRGQLARGTGPRLRANEAPAPRTNRWNLPAAGWPRATAYCMEPDKVWFLDRSPNGREDSSSDGVLSLVEDPSGRPEFIERGGCHAILHCFGNDQPNGTLVPLRFALDTEVISAKLVRKFLGFIKPTPQGDVRIYTPGRVYFEAVSQGLVLTAQYMPGFWFISRAELQTRLPSGR